MENDRIKKLKEEIEYQRLLIDHRKLVKELEAINRPTLRQRALSLIDELEPIKKIKKGEGGAIYSHYTHNDVQQAVMSLMPKYAIFMNAEPVLDKDNGTLIMHIRFEDAYGIEEAIVTSTPVSVGNLKDEKGTGSALSYALKYTLMREFGLGGEDDADDLSKYLSRDQVETIEALLRDAIDSQAIRERIWKQYGVKSFSQIEVKDFNTIIKGIKLIKVQQSADQSKDN